MAENADKALKLAQENEKQVILLWKKIARFEKSQHEWEKKQMNYIARLEKNLLDAINSSNKKVTDLHNKQDKKFANAHNKLVAWINKTFDRKGIFE